MVSVVSSDVYEATNGHDLLRQVCSQLKQSVASMRALAAAAVADPQLPPGARRCLGQIVRQAKWIADMIQDFPGPRADHPNVVDAVSDAVALARLTWTGQVTVMSSAESAVCRLHPILLHRVISNVLSNSMRAAGPSGTVSIQIQRMEGVTLLSVRDSGPGFGRIPAVSGIGLSSVARIMARYEGKVEFETVPAGGTCVSLWLPLADRETTRFGPGDCEGGLARGRDGRRRLHHGR